MQYIGETRIEDTFSAAQMTATDALPETAQENDLLVIYVGGEGGAGLTFDDDATVVDDLAVAWTQFDVGGTTDGNTTFLNTSGMLTVWYKVATGGETSVTWALDPPNIFNGRSYGWVMQLRPAADEEWTVNGSTAPHWPVTPNTALSTGHKRANTKATPTTLSLVAHTSSGALGTAGFETGVAILTTWGSGMLAYSVSTPTQYTEQDEYVFHSGVTVSPGWLGTNLTATSEPAEDVTWSGYAGTRESVVNRIIFPYATVVPPVSPDFFSAYEFERANARGLPYFLHTGMVRDAE